MSKMIKKDEMVGSYSIKPRIQSNVFNDGMQDIPPELLDRFHFVKCLTLNQVIQFFSALHEILYCIRLELFIPK